MYKRRVRAARAGIGVRVFKWKGGVGAAADELALFDDVCAALPAGGKVRLDANGAWDRRVAERWLERCAERPVEYVEQPCFAPAAAGAEAPRPCLLYKYPSPRDRTRYRMPASALKKKNTNNHRKTLGEQTRCTQKHHIRVYGTGQ